MQKLNNYFFGDDQISVQDGLWFYGTLAATVTIIILVSMIRLIG